jgi:hypothetical protein
MEKKSVKILGNPLCPLMRQEKEIKKVTLDAKSEQELIDRVTRFIKNQSFKHSYVCWIEILSQGEPYLVY